MINKIKIQKKHELKLTSEVIVFIAPPINLICTKKQPQLIRCPTTSNKSCASTGVLLLVRKFAITEFYERQEL